ncbi:Uncharacterized protein TCM_003115 [Theobroma cacao]|uniref:Large ribosomal subunit protein uL24 C-terminal domain-containing protein n=1 Tax=Theobroma cacao TaxID=3641 RepID=A0A061DPL5_THECC|nr:Uncharacterized protein TCM_003115 [Theobroma cacao]
MIPFEHEKVVKMKVLSLSLIFLLAQALHQLDFGSESYAQNTASCSLHADCLIASNSTRILTVVRSESGKVIEMKVYKGLIKYNKRIKTYFNVFIYNTFFILLVKKHIKEEQGHEGGIFTVKAPPHASNVQVIDLVIIIIDVRSLVRSELNIWKMELKVRISK